ncbi:MAG TPA: DUF488 domain-containing protein [Thermoplasmata archaeon]|jgi:uncharacterized protein (DUF488 family)
MDAAGRVTVWTIGHSNRSWEDFLALLRKNGIEFLADVRHFPSSAFVPWANRTTLEVSLSAAGIAYEHFADLGGYRAPRPNSRNRGWRNAGFRGYADYMGTKEFLKALGRLHGIAAYRRTSVMCAEAVPWRCHRSLLSDALVAGGTRVVHILSPGRVEDHTLTAFARVHGGRVSYPGSRGKG